MAETFLNNQHIENLRQHFSLGFSKQLPTRVYGGLLHIMWRLDTYKGSYAIKQLTTDINLTDNSVVKNYELSESIATHFIVQGIPAVCAIKKLGQYLLVEDGNWVSSLSMGGCKLAASEHRLRKTCS
jgi:hypothetical protein